MTSFSFCSTPVTLITREPITIGRYCSNFRGQRRTNQTHASTTDGDARLYKKSYGKESKLSYLGHALVENRNGLIAAAMARTPTDTPTEEPTPTETATPE